MKPCRHGQEQVNGYEFTPDKRQHANNNKYSIYTKAWYLISYERRFRLTFTPPSPPTLLSLPPKLNPT